jgi:hypothetical protein
LKALDVTTLSNYEPDYTEEDLQALIQEPRFLAGAQAYANDLIPLSLACHFGFGTPRPLGALPTLSALFRLLHETARRIRVGRIPVSASLWPGYVEDFEHYKKDRENISYPTYLPFSGMFSELDKPRNYDIYLKPRRIKFDEDDLSEMLKNERVLACVDALRRGLIGQAESRKRAYPDGNFPRDLTANAYTALENEVGQRLWDGRVTLPPGIEARYPQVYLPE